MYKKAKRKIKNNDKKISALFIVLLITNIILYVKLIDYYLQIHITIDFAMLNNIFTILSAIIILGVISTRLPKLRNLGNTTGYEIGYLIIMGLFSITISYFNASTHGKSLWSPFIQMFKVLSVLLIFTLIATKFKSFKKVINGEITLKDQILSIIIFSILGILATRYHVNINGIPANVRCLIVMISGLFGGPVVGIPTGIISGGAAYYMGGSIAIPSTITTIISGIIGSVIYLWNGKRFLGIVKTAILMFLFTGFDMFLINILTNEQISIPIINTVYPPMLFASVIGILIFSILVEEQKEDDDESINSIITKQNEKIDKLEKEIEKLKEKN